MRVARAVSWALLLAGVAGLAVAGLRGDLEVFLLVVVPVVAGTGPWAALGLLAAIVGLVGLFWTGATAARAPPGSRARPRRPRDGERAEESAADETQTRGGGVILVGPIPIAWGSDRSTLGWLVAAGLALTLAAIALTLLVRS